MLQAFSKVIEFIKKYKWKGATGVLFVVIVLLIVLWYPTMDAYKSGRSVKVIGFMAIGPKPMPYPTYTLYPTASPCSTLAPYPTYTPYPTPSSYSISGYVKNQIGEPIEQALVLLRIVPLIQPIKTYTDSTGYFWIPLPCKEYSPKVEITVQMEGYKSYRRIVDVTKKIFRLF